MNAKHSFHHAILNLLTLLSVQLENDDISREEKDEMQQSVRLIGLLIGYEDIFLGDQPKFRLKPIHLQEFLKFHISMYQESMSGKNIRIQMPSKKIFVLADTYYFSEALNILILRMLPSATSLCFVFDTDRNMLLVEHNAAMSAIPGFQNLKQQMQKQNMNYENISFQLALRILKYHCQKVSFSRGKICIIFLQKEEGG